MLVRRRHQPTALTAAAHRPRILAGSGTGVHTRSTPPAKSPGVVANDPAAAHTLLLMRNAVPVAVLPVGSSTMLFHRCVVCQNGSARFGTVAVPMKLGSSVAAGSTVTFPLIIATRSQFVPAPAVVFAAISHR